MAFLSSKLLRWPDTSSGGTGHSPGRRSGCRTADEESDDIDEHCGGGQYAEQRCLRQSDPKEGVQRIVAGSPDSNSNAHGHQYQRILVAALTHDEAVFPMTLEGRHEHRA